MRWVEVLRPYPGPHGREYQPGECYREHPSAVPALVRAGRAVPIERPPVGPKERKPVGPKERKPTGPKARPTPAPKEKNSSPGANNPRATKEVAIPNAANPAAQLLDGSPSEEGVKRSGAVEAHQVHALEVGGSIPPSAIDEMSRKALFEELVKLGEEPSKYTSTKNLRHQLEDLREGR